MKCKVTAGFQEISKDFEKAIDAPVSTEVLAIGILSIHRKMDALMLEMRWTYGRGSQ